MRVLQLGAARSTVYFFANDLVLLAVASIQQGFQHTLDQFFAASDRAGMKIITKNPGNDVSLETQGSV